ncbi:MAG: hypothetical protein ACR2JU_12435 [Nocardioidaceae bacterium]
MPRHWALADIATIDGLLEGYTATTVSPVKNAGLSDFTSVQATPAPPMKDAIRAALLDGEDHTPNEISARLVERYDWSAASVRSVMSEMAKDGEIGRPRRGVYNIRAEIAPTDSETDADTSVSDSESSSDGDSVKEGGTGHAGADLRHHDHDPDGAGWNDRGDDRGTSIGGTQ